MSKRRVPAVIASFILVFTLVLAAPATVAAQRVHIGVGVGWGYPGWGWGYPGWGYGPYWGMGWGPYWGGPWGWGPGWGWPGPYYNEYPYAEARILITPKSAEVFVDGYRAGIVDNFDGILQRLNVWPGEHVVTLFLEGYKTENHRMYFNDGTTAKLTGTMEKLGAGEKSEPPPQPAPRKEPQRSQSTRPRVGDPAPDAYSQTQQPPTQSQREPQVVVQQEPAPVKFGGVSIKVLPVDAEIQIDDQVWSSPTGDARLNVQLQTGRHHIAIRKEGFTSYGEDVLIRAGATLTLNISLTKK